MPEVIRLDNVTLKVHDVITDEGVVVVSSSPVKGQDFGTPHDNTVDIITPDTPLDGSIITTFLVQPDIARNFRIIIDHGPSTGNLVFHGTDYDDEVISETYNTADGSGPSIRAFKTLTSIQLPTAMGVTLKVEYGSLLGLSQKYPYNSLLKMFSSSGGDITSSTIVGFDANEISKNTIEPAGSAPSGSDHYIGYFLNQNI